MIAPLVGALVGLAGAGASEALLPRLVRRIEEARPQPGWAMRIAHAPMMEIVAALIGGLAGFRLGWRPALIPALALVMLLVAVAFVDLTHRVIPNRLVLPGTLVALVLQLLVAPSSIASHAAAAVLAGLVFLGLALAYPAGMGLGDVKLAMMLGAFLGVAVVVAVSVGIVASALPAVVIIARHGRRGGKVGLPFGPFLAVGGVVALLWATPLLHWYLHQ